MRLLLLLGYKLKNRREAKAARKQNGKGISPRCTDWPKRKISFFLWLLIDNNNFRYTFIFKMSF